MRKTLIGSLLVLAACQTGPSDAELRERYGRFVGKSESAVIAVGGIPDRVYTADGAKFIGYRMSATGIIGGTRPMVVTNYCNVDFRITGGIVRGYRFDGNSC